MSFQLFLVFRYNKWSKIPFLWLWYISTEPRGGIEVIYKSFTDLFLFFQNSQLIFSWRWLDQDFENIQFLKTVVMQECNTVLCLNFGGWQKILAPHWQRSWGRSLLSFSIELGRTLVRGCCLSDLDFILFWYSIEQKIQKDWASVRLSSFPPHSEIV